MLYLALTQIVQVRLPMSVLLQILGDMPGEENERFTNRTGNREIPTESRNVAKARRRAP